MNSVARQWSKACVIALFLSSGMRSAKADDVTDQLNEAMKAYENKDFATASTALDLALTLIRQMSAERWMTFLPEPLAGWNADDAESTSAGTAMLGGGTSITRKYHRNDDTIEITLMTGSPILQQLGALMTGGVLTGSDMKLTIIAGRKMTYTKSENSYQTMVANKTLVKVEGGKGVGDADLRAYIAAIKFQQIENAAR